MAPEISTDDGEWALDILRQSLRISELASPLIAPTATKLPLDDPEKLEYLRALIRHTLDGRAIATSYIPVLLTILFLFTASHFRQRIIERRKQITIEENFVSDDRDTISDTAEDGEDGAHSSSSSGTLEGSLSSQITRFKDDDDYDEDDFNEDNDIEDQPLLGIRHPSRLKPGVFAVIRSWLMYQPHSIPILNRRLPPNKTSLFVAGYLCLNIFHHLYKLPIESRFFFVFADRAGCLFNVNLPLLYLLAAKNQPLRLLTGRSYEALNIYHRRVGEFMCLEALVHSAGMLVWRLWLQPGWLATTTSNGNGSGGGSLWAYFTHPLILSGTGAFASYGLLYFTSLARFRERWYEAFLASHVALQAAALVFLWLHFATSRPYVLASAAIFVLDRVAWRAGLRSTTLTADVEVLADGRTVLLSANWNARHAEEEGGWRRWWARPGRQTVLYGWRPADHVFVSVPALGGSHALQAHPFTIASAAPGRSNDGYDDDNANVVPARVSLKLLIRARSGFTSALLRHAQQVSPRVSMRADGPYGSRDALRALRASRVAVLVAGGSGIAVAFPLAWDLAVARPRRRRRREVHLLWIVRSAAQRAWVPAGQLDGLRRAGVVVAVPPPTLDAGRPDVAGYVAEIAGASAARVGVLVSGPDGLNRAVRNACASAVRSGVDVDLRVEKFGW